MIEGVVSQAVLAAMPVGSASLPLGFQDWVPGLQALTLAMLTLVQEDVPTFGAAALWASGRLSGSAGFLGCFAGIWAGDVLLYLLARGWGRSLGRQAWFRRWYDPVAIARSERWLALRGTWLLVGSRFLPGTRLPTFLAAGFLRYPFRRFLWITGATVAGWTAGVFLLAAGLGAGRMVVLAMAVLLLAAGARRLVRRLPSAWGWRLRGVVGRWIRWEFWPAWLFYLPVAACYLILALRHRSLALPAAANPGMFTGGLVGESKLDMLRALMRSSPECTADAYPVEGSDLTARVRALRELRKAHDLAFPFILKPDLGQRGVGVKLIRDESEAEACLRHDGACWLVQRYAPGPCEFGVFYLRFPGERHGRILAITEKIFPCLTGDGKQTVEALIWRDPRARCLARTYFKRLGSRCAEVLPMGSTLRLVEAGNHAQGCIFRDGHHLRTDALEKAIDAISRRLAGFYVGRYDLRCASLEDFQRGGPFQIVELNGAASEATSIYDARHSLWHAYRTLFRQWQLVFAVGAANRARGTALLSGRELWRIWRASMSRIATYPLAD